MALKAKVLGREALMRKLNQLAPNVEAAVEPVKLEIAREAAKRIAAAAPRQSGDYAESIRGGYLKDNPANEQVGIRATKDPTAAGIFGSFIWNWLEWGTAPHSTAKGGGTVAGKKAAAMSGVGMHPGTPAQPHVFPVWRSYRKAAMRKMRNAINKAVREARGK